MSDIRKYVELLESSERLTLDEGVIKVPPSLLTHYYKYLLKVISTTIIRSIYRGQYLENSNVDIYKKYDIDFKDHGDNYNASNKDGMRLRSTVNLNEKDFPYGEDDREVTITFYVDKDLTHSAGYYYPVDSNKGSVVISIYNIIQKAFSTINIDTFYDDDEDLIENLKDGIFPMEFDMTLLPLVKSMMTTIEHEFAHAIQHLIIKHDDQRKLNKGYESGGDEYWKSPVEFPTQVITAVRKLEIYFDELYINDPTKKMQVVMYLIGQKTIHELKLDTYNQIELLDNSRTFFDTLKRTKPKAYKKAVKLLYTELRNNGII